MTNPSRSRVVLAAFVVAASILASASRAAADPVPITTCGETDETNVYLPADLDCSSSPTHGIDFRHHAHLNLNGFSVRNANIYGIQCGAGCVIEGPGGIVDGAGTGLRNGGPAVLRNVTISGNAGPAIEAANNPGTGRVRLYDCVVENNSGGIIAQNTVRLAGTVVTGNGNFGLSVRGYSGNCTDKRQGRVRLSDSSVSACSGIDCVDIESCAEPELDETSTCGTSSNVTTDTPWGVCAMD
jgi:hypothetical protein